MVSLYGADAYFEGTLKADVWAGFDEVKKLAAIKEASRAITTLNLMHYKQPNTDYAIYEQAYCILSMPEEAAERQRNIAMGIKSVTVDKHREEYTESGAVYGLVNGVWICPDALRWITEDMRRRSVRSGRLMWREGRCGR